MRRLVLLLILLTTPTLAQQPTAVRLTTDGHLKQRPAWSPDGKSLLFTRHQGATIFLFVLTPEDKTERRLTMGKDPEFDAKQHAFYYARVIEIPTPRWTAYDAKYFGVQMPKEVPMTITERAYTSPIWYTPAK